MEYEVAPGVSSTVNAGKTTHQGIELGGSYDILHDIFKKESPLKPGSYDEGAYSSRPSFDRVTEIARFPVFPSIISVPNSFMSIPADFMLGPISNMSLRVMRSTR